MFLSPHTNKNFFQRSNESLDLTLDPSLNIYRYIDTILNSHFLLNLLSPFTRGGGGVFSRESEWNQHSASPRPTERWADMLRKCTEATNKYSKQPTMTCDYICCL